jgi:hypothetical protein
LIFVELCYKNRVRNRPCREHINRLKIIGIMTGVFTNIAKMGYFLVFRKIGKPHNQHITPNWRWQAAAA